MKKQLLMEELRRQGKAPKKKVWTVLALSLILVLACTAFWFHQTRQARFEEMFQEGLLLREAGKYEQSVDQFMKLYLEQPSFQRIPQTLYQAAEMQNLYLAQYSEALLNFLLIERDFPDAEEVVPARKQAAALYKYRLNDCSQAIVVYQKILDQSGFEDAQLQYEVADCYFRLNNFDQARIEFESLLKNYPQSNLIAEVQYRIAMTYTLESKLPEAAGAYRLVMERWPESPYALEAGLGLATVLEEQEELKAALKVLDGLAEKFPNQEILRQKRAQVSERMEKKKKAI